MLSFREVKFFWLSDIFLLVPPGYRGWKLSSPLLSKSPSVLSLSHLLLFRSMHALYVKRLNWLTVGLIQVQSCLTVLSLDFSAASHNGQKSV